MGTLKNILLYGCDLLRVVFVKIPVNLVMTGRGRIALLVISALAIFLTGFYFYKSAEIIFLPAPNRVEKETAVVFENKIINPVKFIFDAKMYFSAEDFIKDLNPGAGVSSGYYKGVFSKPDAENNEIDFVIWVKVYYGQTKNGNAIFLDHFPASKYDLDNFRMLKYDETGVTVVSRIARDDIPLLFWVFGSTLWLICLIYVLVIKFD